VPLGVPAQHPVGHGCDALHVKLQMPLLHPCAPGPQSPTALQPHWPPPVTASQTCPCVLPAQALQVPPLLPHCALVVPATHLPADEQQPPLQGCAPLHAVVHRCVVASHALPAGQSATELQPQNVAPPLVMHCAPAALDAQLVHAGSPAGTAHAAAVFPCTHVPALQQPPLHVKPPAHADEHACVDGLHACPTGQSPGFAQPPEASPASRTGPVSPGPPSTTSASAPPVSGCWITPSAFASSVPSPAASLTSCSPLTSRPHEVAAAIGAADHARSARSHL
jgi:hypothetical protein